MLISEKIDLITKALINFHIDQMPIAPNATNPFLKNKYADLPTLVACTKDNLAKCKLTISQILDNEGLTTILLHESGQFISGTAPVEPTESKGTNKAQQMGVAITYTRRYAYASILGLVTDEDTDGATTKKEKSNETKTENKDEDKTLISEAQLKRLNTILSKSNADIEDCKTICGNFGYTSRKLIKRTDYDEIIRQIENFEPEASIGDENELPPGQTYDKDEGF